jgi:hypothetical protein
MMPLSNSCKLLSPARAIEWMYVDSLRMSYSLRSQNASSARTASSSDSKCCDSCALPTVKYYSINHVFKQCGESCIDPKDYDKYKALEPGFPSPVCCPLFSDYYTDIWTSGRSDTRRDEHALLRQRLCRIPRDSHTRRVHSDTSRSWHVHILSDRKITYMGGGINTTVDT